VRAILYVRERTVLKKTKKRPKKEKNRRLHSAGDERDLPYLSGLYRPMKHPVTLRLDADVIQWFKKQGGRGYQTRINQALRKLMLADLRKSKR
jgi:uncharacterized protein (DUF4415 family)